MPVGQDQPNVPAAHLRVATTCVGARETKRREPLHKFLPGDRRQSGHDRDSYGLRELIQVDSGYDWNVHPEA